MELEEVFMKEYKTSYLGKVNNISNWKNYIRNFNKNMNKDIFCKIIILMI